MVPVQGWLPAGEYLTDEFKPAFSFGVDEGWQVYSTETGDSLVIGQPENVGLGFRTIHKVYDPQDPGFNTLPAPDDMVAWFQKHPHLDAEEPVPVSVGGVPGTQLDVSVSSAPDNYLTDCLHGESCLPLWPAARGSPYGLPEGQGERMIILDVRGETVIVTRACLQSW